MRENYSNTITRAAIARACPVRQTTAVDLILAASLRSTLDEKHMLMLCSTLRPPPPSPPPPINQSIKIMLKKHTRITTRDTKSQHRLHGQQTLHQEGTQAWGAKIKLRRRKPVRLVRSL